MRIDSLKDFVKVVRDWKRDVWHYIRRVLEE